MLNKPFKSYVDRRLQNYEELQVNNFSELTSKVYGNFPEGIFEFEGCGIVIPCEDSYMKVLIEEANSSYRLVNLVDLAERKARNSVWCLIPNELFLKDGLSERFNVCIRFNQFKKIFFTHTSITTGDSGKWACVVLDSYEIINPIKLRLLNRRDSSEASELRNEILFKHLDEDVNPYLKLAVLNALFLSPRIDSKNGIESYSLIDKSSARYFINLDNYNTLLRLMVPPEISNTHQEIFNPDTIEYTSSNYNEKLKVYAGYPADFYKYDATLSPSNTENQFEQFRILENAETGITHQTSLSAFNDKKEVLDKLQQSEFYFLQQEFPLYAITKLSKPQKLVLDNEELLYADYANRLTISLTKQPVSIFAQKRIKELVREQLELQGYTAKESDDQYFNNKVRILMGNFNRVKTTLQRSNTVPEASLESTYLASLETSLRDITQNSNFKQLTDRAVNNPLIQKLRNDAIKIQILNVFELKNGQTTEEEIIGILIKEGFEIKELLKKIIELKKMGLIYSNNNKLRLSKKEI